MIRDLCQYCGEPFDVPDHGCQHHCVECCDCCDFNEWYDAIDEADQRIDLEREEGIC